MPRLWIFTNRPNTLIDCLAIANVLGPDHESTHLVYQDDKPWERANWDEFKPHFTKVHAVPRLKAIRGLAGAVKYARNISSLRATIQSYGISREDRLICHTVLTPLGQVVASSFRENYKVVCTSQRKARDFGTPIDFKQYRFTTPGWFNFRIVDPLFGLEPIYNLKTRHPQGADGERLRRFKRELSEVYDATVVFRNAYTQQPAAAPRTFSPPYPNITFLREEAARTAGNWVIFFGTPFLLLKNLPPEDYARILNQALDYLRQSYPGAKLVYRPHPFEKEEQMQLNLERFEIQNDKEAAELYLLRNASRVQAVFTVSSTVSRTAMNFGFNAYALWPLFPFQERTAEFFRSIMGEVPDAFHIQSMSEPPAPYASPEAIRESFDDFAETMRGALTMTAPAGQPSLAR